jgi:hypothetical protein
MDQNGARNTRYDVDAAAIAEEGNIDVPKKRVSSMFDSFSLFLIKEYHVQTITNRI